MCIVPGCNNVGRHAIPRVLYRRLLWMKAIGIEEHHLTNRTSLVCPLHFKDTDYMDSEISPINMKRRCLKRHAVPSIFPWNQPPSTEENLDVPKIKSELPDNETEPTTSDSFQDPLCAQEHDRKEGFVEFEIDFANRVESTENIQIKQEVDAEDNIFNSDKPTKGCTTYRHSYDNEENLEDSHTDMPGLTLWVTDSSPPCWAIRMLGEILGLDFELKKTDFMNLEHKSPEYLKRNPMGTIPILQDGDFVISESHTIMRYLLDKYGSFDVRESLYPSELKARALVDQALFFDTGVAFIRVKIIALPTLFEGLPGMTSELIQKTEEVYGIVELYLDRNRYIAADHLTLADLSLGTTVLALDRMYSIDTAKYPKTVSWLKKLQEEPYFSRVALSGAEILHKFINVYWEKNKKK